MKKAMVVTLVLCLLITGCSLSKKEAATESQVSLPVVADELPIPQPAKEEGFTDFENDFEVKASDQPGYGCPSFAKPWGGSFFYSFMGKAFYRQLHDVNGSSRYHLFCFVNDLEDDLATVEAGKLWAAHILNENNVPVPFNGDTLITNINGQIVTLVLDMRHLPYVDWVDGKAYGFVEDRQWGLLRVAEDGGWTLVEEITTVDLVEVTTGFILDRENQELDIDEDFEPHTINLGSHLLQEDGGEILAHYQAVYVPHSFYRDYMQGAAVTYPYIMNVIALTESGEYHQITVTVAE